jgi:NPCBM-associated, NEW3 domain of alpha-galactosidase
MRPVNRILFRIATVCLVFFQNGYSQTLYNPNDERFKSLYLEKVQSEFSVQKEEYGRQSHLRESGLISEREYRESELRFNNARITYLQAVLSLAFEQPHITIEQAIKYQSRDRKKRVRLTLKNTTSGLVEGKQIELSDLEGIRTDHITNVYVSLLNDQNAIVSQPYEAKILSIPYNRSRTADFFLLQDLDYVIVKILYGTNSEEKKIFLQKDESVNRVLIGTEQFSQEANLGSTASFELTLELFSSIANIYKLQVLNLPHEVSYDFLDPTANARLSQVRFSQDVHSRKLVLTVYLPPTYDTTSFSIDQPLGFFAVVVPQQVLGRIRPAHKYTFEEIDSLQVGYARLELIPRGVGSLQVRADNFYAQLGPNEKAQLTLTVRNDGTRPLNNIRVQTDLPLNWVSAIKPDLIPSLLPNKEEVISVTIIPSADVSVGEYEVTVHTDSFAGGRTIESDPKRIRIEVKSNVNVLGTVGLVFLLISALVGVLIFGVRLSRR